MANADTDRRPWHRLVLAIVALLWIAVGTGITSSNDGSHLALARALALRHETTIEPEADLTLWVDRAAHDGHEYSDRPPGTAFAALAAVWLGDRLDPWLRAASRERGAAVVSPAGLNYARTHEIRGRRSPALLDLQGTALVLRIHCAAIGVLGLWAMCALLAARGIGEGGLCACVAGMGLGTLWGPYATVLFSHGTAAALVASTLLALERAASGSPRRRELPWCLAGTAGAWAVATDYALILLVVPWVATAVPVRRWSWPLLGASPIVLATAAYHAAAFGSPISFGYQAQTNFAFTRSVLDTFDGAPWAGSWTLLGLGRGAGMLAQSPLALVGLLTFFAAESRRLVWSVVPWLVLVSMHHTPWGGATMDHRYLVPLLPLVGLGLGRCWVHERAGVRLALGALGVVSGVLVWSHFQAWRDG